MFLQTTVERPLELPFIRKGEVGDWKNYLTKEQSQQMDKVLKEKGIASGLDKLWDNFPEIYNKLFAFRHFCYYIEIMILSMFLQFTGLHRNQGRSRCGHGYIPPLASEFKKYALLDFDYLYLSADNNKNPP